MSNVIKSTNIYMGQAFFVEPYEVAPVVVAEDIPEALAELSQQEQREIIQFLADAKVEAQQIIADGQAQVNHLRQQLEDEMARQSAEAKEQAYSEGQRMGYEDGYAQGYEQAMVACRQENLDAAHSLGQALELFQATKQQVIDQSLDDLKYLAWDIAAKVVYEAVGTDPNLYLPMIKSALDGLRNFKWVDIYVSNQEKGLAVLLEEQLAQMLERQSVYIRVRSQEDLSPGSCMLETDVGAIDIGLDTQLGKIRGVLEG